MNKRTHRPLLSLLGAVTLLLGTHVSPSPAKASTKPNILFFFIDDMGWQDTSEPFWKEVTALNQRYRTPNMVKLADQGIKFTQAYACAVCSPSRVSLMTDNGCPKNLPRNLPLRGHKLAAYEGGTRVPMIVKWPHVVQPGTVCSEDYVIIEDIFPTFLEMAGITDDRTAAGRVDGRSFLPLLKGVEGISKGRSIFWHFPHTYDQPAYSSVRRDDWKLIYFHANRELELYNLKRDIGETMNLAEQEPETLAERIQVLSDFLRESGALMPIDKRTKRPVEYPDEWVSINRGNRQEETAACSMPVYRK